MYFALSIGFRVCLEKRKAKVASGRVHIRFFHSVSWFVFSKLSVLILVMICNLISWGELLWILLDIEILHSKVPSLYTFEFLLRNVFV